MYRNSDGDSIDDLRRRNDELEETLAEARKLIRTLKMERIGKVLGIVTAGAVATFIGICITNAVIHERGQVKAEKQRAAAEVKAKREKQVTEQQAREAAKKAKLKAENKAAREFNQKARKALFEGAELWIKKYTDGSGDAYCYNTGAFDKEPVDGVQPRVDDGSLYTCDVLRENAPTIKIQCCPSLKKCYKVQP